MDALLTSPLTTSLLTSSVGGYGPWHAGGPAPWLLVPLLFWALVIGAVVLTVRRRRSRGAEHVLRDAFARGDVDEAGYRERLAVLRSTRR